MSKPGEEALIPIAVPTFGPSEEEAVLQCLRSGWVAQGPRVASFERRFTRTTSAPHTLACSNGTAALHLSLAALGIGPGDEVIVPAFTWVATANVVELLGARAVLCDIDPNTFCASAEHFAPLITARTRALMPVHLFGAMAPMRDILALADRHGLAVVEDAACALGSTLHGQHAGTFGDAGAFSFHPRKTITSGEGGVVTTKREDLATTIACLRNHGALGTSVPPTHQAAFMSQSQEQFRATHPGSAAYIMSDFTRPGFNYRLTDIQGAILDVQLSRLPDLLAARRRLAARYQQELAGLPLALPTTTPHSAHSYQSYVVRVLPEAKLGRDALADALARRNIQTRQGTHALHLLGAYQDRTTPEALPGALTAHRHSLALPLFPTLREEDQDRVIQATRQALS